MVEMKQEDAISVMFILMYVRRCVEVSKGV